MEEQSRHDGSMSVRTFIFVAPLTDFSNELDMAQTYTHSDNMKSIDCE